MAFEFDSTTAAPVDFDPGTAQPVKPAGAIRRLADAGLALGRGVIGLPEAAVGVADLATNGQAGKLAESAGIRFKDAKDYLSSLQSPEQQTANQEVNDAKGFVPTLGAMVKNPSTIVNSTLESAPSMLLGAGVARGAMALAPKLGAIGAGAIGEGAVAAGQNAEQVRQEEPTGSLTPQQSAILAGSGALTGVISRLSGGVANRLGIGDAQTMLAAGKLGAVGEQAVAKGAQKGVIRKIAEGAAVEGGLQELPQSYQEQVGQNIAQGKPWDEGAGAAGAQGLLVGGAMGAVAGPLHGPEHAPVTPPAPAGPLTRAASLALPAPVVRVNSEGAARMDGQPAPLADEPAANVQGRAPIDLPTQPNPLALPPPTVTVDAQGNARAPGQNVDTVAPRALPAPVVTVDSTGQAATGAQRLAATQAQTGDILADSGKPFKNRMGAANAARNAGNGYVPVQVDGGFVARRDVQDVQAKPISDNVDAAAHQAAASPLNDKPEPTKAQILAGNAELGHARIGPLQISIETPSGAFREDKQNVPPKWRTQMNGVHYGYIKRTVAADSTDAKKQGVDAFIKEGTPADYNGPVFVVDQVNKDGSFDEHKAVIGPANEMQARQTYLKQYEKGWKGIGAITKFPTVEAFNQWAKDGQKSEPASPDLAARAAPAAVPAGNSEAPANQPAANVTAGANGPTVEPNAALKGQPNVEKIQGPAGLPVEARAPAGGNKQASAPAGSGADRSGGGDQQKDVGNVRASASGRDQGATSAALKGVPNAQRQGEGAPPVRDGAAPSQPAANRVEPPVVRAQAASPKADGAGIAGGTNSLSEQPKTLETSRTPTDVSDPNGKPFRTRQLAQDFLDTANRKTNTPAERRARGPRLAGFEVAPLSEGGFVLRKGTKEPTIEKPVAPTALRIGITSLNAEPVSIKDGVVHVGKEPALNFDSGEPVKVVSGASEAQIKQALKDAGALSKRQKFFGGTQDKSEGPTAPALDAKEQIDREAKDQTLTQPVAPEQRKDTTGDLLGGPTKEEALAAKQKADEAKGKPKDDGGTVPMFSRSKNTEPFYSALSREVEKIPAKAMPHFGWMSQIQGLIKSGKVKADEVAWTGLDDWLKMQQGKVTREQIGEFLKNNGVQVKEVTLGGKIKEDADGIAKRKVIFDKYEPEIQRIYKDMDKSANTAIQMRQLREVQEKRDAEADAAYTIPANEPSKYGSYQLPGGTNYREVLLTLPSDVKPEDRGTAYARETSTDYRSSHWDEPNVLAHIRLNDRTDADGKRVLFVEEIQSDWAQQGKKEGFTNITPAEQKEYDGLVKRFRGDRTESENARVRELEAKGANSPKVRIPSAPFVGKTDAWVSLALKRIVKMAADEGYDKVAFVNGEQSADRYDLSKKISRVEYLDNHALGVGLANLEGPPSHGLLRAYNHDGNAIIDKSIQDATKELPDLIGKDLAEKLLNAPGKSERTGGGNHSRVKELAGLDLKVGGEGMKAFYDKIVPSVAKEVVRKLGGDGLNQSTITTDKEGWHITPPEQTTHGKWMVKSSDYNSKGLRFDTEAEAKAALAEKQATSAQTAFDITPAMREKAEGGLPLFKRADTEGAPLRVSEIRRAIAPALDSLKVPYELHSSIGEARDSSGLSDIPGGVKGMYYGGKLHLVAEGIKSPLEAEETLWHEVNHAGVDAMYGSSKNTTGYYNAMRGLAMQNANIREGAKEWLREFGADDTRARIAAGMTRDAAELRTKLQAVEEALSNLAGKNAKINGLTRFIAKVQEFMRAVGLNRLADSMEKMTDAQALAMIFKAREAVTKEPQTQRAPQLAPSFSEQAGGEPASFSRTSMAGQTNRQYTPDQEKAFKNVGFKVEQPTAVERAKALWQDAGKKLAQGIVDQFAPVKDLDKQAYGLLRLAKGASGAFEAMLRGGQLKITDGTYDFDSSKKGGVVDRLLIPLQGEHHDFMRWVAANRAERLMREGKENLFTAADIAALKTLDTGVTDFDYTLRNAVHGVAAGTVTRDRTLIYRDSLAIFNEFNKNTLDMAEQSGLIDPASRHLWEHEFYVPFYRVVDEADGGVRGMNIKAGVVRQQAFKQLKGGKGALNADLLDNTLMNWAHLLDAAAKNRAAKATLEAAERMGVAIGAPQSVVQQIGGATGTKNGIVWFMDGGQKRHFVVDDPYLLTAINGLEFAGMRSPVMAAMGTFKHALTMGVTASPFFKVRNLIRDSVQAIGTGPLSYNIGQNLVQGFKLTDPKSDAYFRLLAGGGTIHFGTMLEGSEARRVQALVKSGVRDSTILNTDGKVRDFYDKFIQPGIAAYNELGNRGEAINRASLYAQLTAQGMSHAEASLQARDLMDFSMQGSFTSIRFLTQVVPFFNARIQGLYKLGRAAKEDPARFSVVLGTAALISVGLLAAYSDDDDWKKRELWDQQNFWWFKFGGTAFRIPKPFEIGAIATLAEHGAQLAFDDEMTGKRFREAALQLVSNNLSMNPIPQLVKPVLDVYANQDSFSNRPIETMGMEKLKPEYRFNDRTSMAARGASTALNAAAETIGAQGPSPVQIDHLIRGYFGWLGSFVVGAGDALARPATNQPTQAQPDYWKAATGGMVSDLRDAPSKYVSRMYDQSKELEQAYGTWKALQKEGKGEEAAAFREANQKGLAQYHQVERVKRGESFLNQQLKSIERADLPADVKRERIREVQDRKDRLARSLAQT